VGQWAEVNINTSLGFLLALNLSCLKWYSEGVDKTFKLVQSAEGQVVINANQEVIWILQTVCTWGDAFGVARMFEGHRTKVQGDSSRPTI